MKPTVSGAMLTDRGLVRATNEDAVAYILPDNCDAGNKRVALAVVADGMGGHSAGEVASSIAIQTIIRRFFETDGAVPLALISSFSAANEAILARSREDPECTGMGTTCTALAIHGGQAYLAHIGDSRAYLLSNGVFRQISMEHSLVARMVRDGMIPVEAAATHPDRNVILQALGTSPDISPQIWDDGYPLNAGDRFLLCSDGLSDLVDEFVMIEAIAHLSPADACRMLVDAALKAGGIDNISVGVFAINAPEPDPPNPTRNTQPMTL